MEGGRGEIWKGRSGRKEGGRGRGRKGREGRMKHGYWPALQTKRDITENVTVLTCCTSSAPPPPPLSMALGGKCPAGERVREMQVELRSNTLGNRIGTVCQNLDC